MTNAEARAALAQCGLTTDHITSQMKVLSGGENAKVRICRIMLKEVNLLVLDEPTNHLDVDAKDSLKKAINDYSDSQSIRHNEQETVGNFVKVFRNKKEQYSETSLQICSQFS